MRSTSPSAFAGCLACGASSFAGGQRRQVHRSLHRRAPRAILLGGRLRRSRRPLCAWTSRTSTPPRSRSCRWGMRCFERRRVPGGQRDHAVVPSRPRWSTYTRSSGTVTCASRRSRSPPAEQSGASACPSSAPGTRMSSRCNTSGRISTPGACRRKSSGAAQMTDFQLWWQMTMCGSGCSLRSQTSAGSRVATDEPSSCWRRSGTLPP
mmetsp:Transcript_126652/g.358250  ORF Transcript_126652/g.358250 Transcript_126652/m.358250 type:complete len:208 (+) Transcript_126652:777-1400(+)